MTVCDNIIVIVASGVHDVICGVVLVQGRCFNYVFTMNNGWLGAVQNCAGVFPLDAESTVTVDQSDRCARGYARVRA